MMTRRAALLLGLALPGLALAQGTPRAAELDQLFAVLREGQDAAQIALAEARIRQLWLEAASPAARLLLQRGTRNLNARLPEEAIEDFDAALTLAPNAASAWNHAISSPCKACRVCKRKRAMHRAPCAAWKPRWRFIPRCRAGPRRSGASGLRRKVRRCRDHPFGL